MQAPEALAASQIAGLVETGYVSRCLSTTPLRNRYEIAPFCAIIALRQYASRGTSCEDALFSPC